MQLIEVVLTTEFAFRWRMRSPSDLWAAIEDRA